MSPRYKITCAEAVEQVLADLDGPTAIDEIYERVLDLWPSQAKNPRPSIRTEVRSRHAGRDIVFLDEQTLIPLRIAMQGVRFRISLSREEVDQGAISIFPWFRYLVPREFNAKTVRLIGPKGWLLRTGIKSFTTEIQGDFGTVDVGEGRAFDVARWFRRQRIKRGDSVLVTIEDWEAGWYRLEHEPAAARREQEIAAWDEAFADRLYARLENAQDESIEAHVAIPTVTVHMAEHGSYPGHHWTEILENDPRMRYDGYTIHYGDTPTSRALFPYEQPIPQVAFTPEEGRQVYRFKVGRRRIEIQGDQSLVEFDDILRTAFGYAHHDHLSGFWKRIRRGDSNRFREVDVGTVDPFEGGNAADVAVAGLGLAAGQTLKYVYDFGDWFEQRLVLEAITAPEPDVDYPRLVGQRKSHP